MESNGMRTRPRRGRVAGALAAAVLFVALSPQSAGASEPDKQPIHEFATGEPIADTFSMLRRGDDSVTSKIRTAATPGHVVTIWYVIFNAPDQCNTGGCGNDDVFVAPGQFNAAQIEAARISVVYGGDGDVVNNGGRVALDGGLAEGQVPVGTNQVVIGRADGEALVPLSPVTGLEDAQGAEIHIVLQDHGPAHDTQEMLDAQLTQFRGACNDTCEDVQFAVHK